jgi:hypothetical protein
MPGRLVQWFGRLARRRRRGSLRDLYEQQPISELPFASRTRGRQGTPISSANTGPFSEAELAALRQ